MRESTHAGKIFANRDLVRSATQVPRYTVFYKIGGRLAVIQNYVLLQARRLGPCLHTTAKLPAPKIDFPHSDVSARKRAATKWMRVDRQASEGSGGQGDVRR
jgi:hypothetical protein